MFVQIKHIKNTQQYTKKENTMLLVWYTTGSHCYIFYTGVRSSNELQGYGIEIGHQDNSPNKAQQGDMPQWQRHTNDISNSANTYLKSMP